MTEDLAHYIEDVAHYWEQQGLPRIAGRIVALLMVCAPPYRSAQALAQELGVSRGSVSTMTRLLLQSESIEVVPRPGERATFYALVTDGLERKMTARMNKLVAFQALAQRGLTLLADDPPERAQRLKDITDIYEFMAREIPLLIERFHAEREARDD